MCWVMVSDGELCPGIGITEWRKMDALTRLRAILEDRVIRFNPYMVDDVALVECAERGYWRGIPALTQMVVFHFHEIREVKWRTTYDAAFFHIGDRVEDERFLSVKSLVSSNAHHTTKAQIRTTLNNRYIVRSNVKSLRQKSVFVSNALYAVSSYDRYIPKYRMYTLRGDIHSRAATIRAAMIEAKLSMLEDLLKYPTSDLYLGPIPPDLDYRTPICNAIESIKCFDKI